MIQDLRFALRLMRKYKGFTLLAVITLALGIGANTAIFSIVNAVLLRPLPYPNPELLVTIYDSLPSINFPRAGLSEGEFINLRTQNKSFSEISARYWGEAVLSQIPEPERIIAPFVTANYFRTLDIRPALGRDFLPEEEIAGQNQFVILTHQLWNRKFAADPSIVGHSITLDNTTYTVVGVLPADFRAPHELSADTRVDLWRAYDFNPARVRRGNQGLTVIGRLRPDATIVEAEAESRANTLRELNSYPAYYPRDIVNHIEPLTQTVIGNVRQSLLILLAAVAIVLLIACANVASLLLVRGEERQKEIAVRAALGAGRGRIVCQMLAESGLLALLGGSAGIVLAHWVLQGLLMISPVNIPRLTEATLDPRVLGVALIISLLTAVIFGLVPALHAVRFDLQTMLKESGRGSQQISRSRLRKALVVTETMLAVVLLAAAGLLLRSYRELQRVDTGYRPDHLLTLKLTPPNAMSRGNQQSTTITDLIIEQVKTLPGVTAVGAADTLPLDGGSSSTIIEIAGRPLDMTRLTNMSTQFGGVSPGYFQTIGAQLLRGRTFSTADQEGTQPVVLINETLARNHWPNEDPLGKQFRLLDAPPERATTRYLTIVGVVADTKNRGLAEATRQEAFVPFAQKTVSYGRMGSGTDFSLVLRTVNDPLRLSNTVRREVRQIDQALLITQVRTMEEIMAETIVQPRFNTLLIGSFSLLALGLGIVGLYGVISSIVAQRTKEIGIRMALGAQRSDVLRLVLREGMLLAGLGVGLGLLEAAALTRLLNNLLFGVSTTDPLTFVLVPSLLLGVAFLASVLPARRATKIDPLTALRHE